MSSTVAFVGFDSKSRRWLPATLGSLTLCLTLGLGCSSSGGGAGSGGAQSSSGGHASGGTTASSGGTTTTGGSQGSGGAGGAGGSQASGGKTGSGGTVSTGGASNATGGNKATGGTAADTGGSKGTGGATTAAGGSKGTGGATAAGGATATGTGGSAGGSSGTRGSGGSGGSSIDGGSTTGAVPSAGCGKTPTLKNSPSAANQNTLSVGGKDRQFIMRWPDNYDNTHPYRLIIGLHGATGKDTDIGPSYFGLWDLSKNSTIFLAPSADGGLWNATNDSAFVDAILKAVEADLCIDTSRIMLEGFSQGAAMSWTLACGRAGVFRAAVGHSGGGVANPSKCQPIPYLGSGGLQENVTQTSQTDQFAKWNGCTVATLPTAPTGSHVCTSYSGCPAADPVRWCSYDGPHTPSPTDSGQRTSWMPSEVWPFLSQF